MTPNWCDDSIADPRRSVGASRGSPDVQPWVALSRTASDGSYREKERQAPRSRDGRGRRRPSSLLSLCSADVKLARLETLACDAGWRPWLFVKATTDDGLVGWSEVTDSHGSPTGLAGVVRDLAPLVVGRDPLAVEAIHWDLYRRTRQSPGSIVQKAIGGIENALLDLKGKALGVSVAELFGGPTRETIPLYWSHCGTTRARAWEVTGTPKLDSYDAVAALGREVVERGLPRLQDEHRRPRPGAAGADARLRPRAAGSTATPRPSCSRR